MSAEEKQKYVDLNTADRKRNEAQCKEMAEKGFFTLEDGSTSESLLPKVKMPKKPKTQKIE